MPDNTPLTSSFTATGQSGGKGVHGAFNVSISGTFVATINLERSFDIGANWRIVKTYTDVAEDNGVEVESGVQYRFNCTAFTSGTAVCRLGNGTNEFIP